MKKGVSVFVSLLFFSLCFCGCTDAVDSPPAPAPQQSQLPLEPASVPDASLAANSAGDASAAAASSSMTPGNTVTQLCTLHDGRTVSVDFPSGMYYESDEHIMIYPSHSFSDIWRFEESASEQEAKVGRIFPGNMEFFTQDGDIFSYYSDLSGELMVFTPGGDLEDFTYYQFGNFYAFTEPPNGVSRTQWTNYINPDADVVVAFAHEKNPPSTTREFFESIVSTVVVV